MQKLLALLGAKSKKEFVALLAQFIKHGLAKPPEGLLSGFLNTAVFVMRRIENEFCSPLKR